MVPFKYEQFIKDLTDLVESGEVTMSRIDDAVERILRVKFVAGLFEHPLTDRSLLGTVGCKVRSLVHNVIRPKCWDKHMIDSVFPWLQEHRELARESVRKSLVLLKNGTNSEKPFLPLDRNVKRILVTGTHADDLGYQCGGWTKAWFGLSGRITIGN